MSLFCFAKYAKHQNIKEFLFKTNFKPNFLLERVILERETKLILQTAHTKTINNL